MGVQARKNARPLRIPDMGISLKSRIACLPQVAAARTLAGLAVAVAEALDSQIGDPLIAVIRECPDH